MHDDTSSIERRVLLTANPLRARNAATGAVGHYCEKVAPECANCYAEAFNLRTRPTRDGKHLIGTGLRYAPSSLPRLEPLLEEKVLAEVRRRRKPATIFWCSMTDLFGDWHRDEWLDAVFGVIDQTPRHIHMLLTKRPERFRDYVQGRYGPGPLPSQIWAGVTAGCQRSADERIPVLRQIRARVRFVSAEPLLEPVLYGDLTGIHWLIAGGESGRRARPCDVRWMRDVVGQCRAAGVPCFVKQLGENSWDRDRRLSLTREGGDPAEWPEDLRVQEWPREGHLRREEPGRPQQQLLSFGE